MNFPRRTGGAREGFDGPRSDAPDAHAPVDGIVLAAGTSARMGAPKPLLTTGEVTFVESAIAALADGGCREVVVVTRPGSVEVEQRARVAGARVVQNPVPASEQVDSLRVGLEALRADAAAALVLPVDQPRVTARTAGAVLAAWRDRGATAPVARPTHGGVPGHPTLFARALFDELSKPGLPEGARTVIARHEARILDVPVDEPGAVQDVNTPEEYLRQEAR